MTINQLSKFPTMDQVETNIELIKLKYGYQLKKSIKGNTTLAPVYP